MMDDGQKTLLLAGLAGCARDTARKYLRGEPIKGANLRARLATAQQQLAKLASGGDIAKTAPVGA